MSEAGTDGEGHGLSLSYRRRSEVILCPTGQSLHSPTPNCRETVSTKRRGRVRDSHVKALVVTFEHELYGFLESFPPLA